MDFDRPAAKDLYAPRTARNRLPVAKKLVAPRGDLRHWVAKLTNRIERGGDREFTRR
jgi:hypothetical protein